MARIPCRAPRTGTGHAGHLLHEIKPVDAVSGRGGHRQVRGPERNLIERYFSKLKHFRRVATRYDKLAANFLAMVQLASIRLWLRAYESADVDGMMQKGVGGV
jgi:Transposase DDE domain